MLKSKSVIELPCCFLNCLEYDLNGNITQKASSNGNMRRMHWDESNRLRVLDDEHSMQHYIYDASGERILKGTSEIEQVYENGTPVLGGGAIFSTYTSYPSAYIVVTGNGEYSKHYYAGSRRIVSRMGECRDICKSFWENRT